MALPAPLRGLRFPRFKSRKHLPVLLARLAEKVDAFPKSRNHSHINFKARRCFGLTLRTARNHACHISLHLRTNAIAGLHCKMMNAGDPKTIAPKGSTACTGGPARPHAACIAVTLFPAIPEGVFQLHGSDVGSSHLTSWLRTNSVRHRTDRSAQNCQKGLWIRPH
jgi:hypothetical protein